MTGKKEKREFSAVGKEERERGDIPRARESTRERKYEARGITK